MSRASIRPMSLVMRLNDSSSSKGACQPPCLKPPSVSSSGPPGACMTPSRVTNSLTMSWPMLSPPLSRRSMKKFFRTEVGVFSLILFALTSAMTRVPECMVRLRQPRRCGPLDVRGRATNYRHLCLGDSPWKTTVGRPGSQPGNRFSRNSSKVTQAITANISRKGLEDGAFGRRGVYWRCYKRSHAESRRHRRLFNLCDHSQTDRSEKPKGSLEGDRRLSLWGRCRDVRWLKTFSGGQRPDDQ